MLNLFFSFVCNVNKCFDGIGLIEWWGCVLLFELVVGIDFRLFDVVFFLILFLGCCCFDVVVSFNFIISIKSVIRIMFFCML